MSFFTIKDISIITKNTSTLQEIIDLYNNSNIFNTLTPFELTSSINFDIIKNQIDTRLKKRMSDLSLGIFYVMDNGPDKKINDDDDIYFFTGFGEIETTKKIIDQIIISQNSLVSPTHFHNSVHNTPMGYYTIIKGKNNYATTITDGMKTDLSFISLIEKLVKVENRLTITGGDENSEFYKLDKTVHHNLPAVFFAYNVLSGGDRGCRFLGCFNSLKNIENYDYIIADRHTFIELEGKVDQSGLLTEYSLTYDSPTSIGIRIALPFVLKLQNSLIIHQTESLYYLFEVKL